MTVTALAFVVVVTVAWWAVALWPVHGHPPGWLLTTRAVCFGAAEGGLPSPAGWLMLIGEPIAMTLALATIAGTSLRQGLNLIMGSYGGRAVLAGMGALTIAGVAGASVHVIGVLPSPSSAADPLPSERLDIPAPPIDLVDQSGHAVSLGQFRGRIVLVGFVFGHCTTICPVTVHELLTARTQLSAVDPAILLVTLDPWRDTPARLGAIADRWALNGKGLMLGGSVPQVEHMLDAWQLARVRDSLTGEITHATPVFIVDREGRLAYRVLPYASSIVSAAREAEKRS